jgi:hypothetical protein
MLGRFAARAITGPAAFLLAGLVDVGVLAFRSLLARGHRRRRRGRARRVRA